MFNWAITDVDGQTFLISVTFWTFFPPLMDDKEKNMKMKKNMDLLPAYHKSKSWDVPLASYGWWQMDRPKDKSTHQMIEMFYRGDAPPKIW